MHVRALSLKIAREQLETVIQTRLGRTSETKALVDAIEALISAHVAYDLKRALPETPSPSPASAEDASQPVRKITD